MNAFGKLRQIQQSELAEMLCWRNAPTVRANMYTRQVISLDDHVLWWENTSKKEDCRYLMFEFHDKACGIVSFTAIDLKNKNCSWAFYSSPDAPIGTGIRMEFLALDYAFDTLGMYKLHCEVLVFNVRVIKMHKKFGFIEEGVFRSHHYYDDHYVDICRLGLLASEWQKSRSAMMQRIGSF